MRVLARKIDGVWRLFEAESGERVRNNDRTYADGGGLLSREEAIYRAKVIEQMRRRYPWRPSFS